MKNSISPSPKHLLCFSHLRWDFVFQRPQHLMNRFAKDLNVYFLEEPVFTDNSDACLNISKVTDTIHVVLPHLPVGLNEKQINKCMTLLLDKFLSGSSLSDWIFWYYTPMALSFSEKYKARLTIYDCMDELSAFKYAPVELISYEKKLMAAADLVFTGGHSLYEAKKKQHTHIFPFPSSIEKHHFESARKITCQPLDQATIKGVKIGFYGVIDERFDIELIKTIADERPEWQIVLIGPVVKIDPETLPKNANIHYLGQKCYAELPHYLSGWDVALIPFLLNESTRFISPTKTPEYLAAGVPVVSTPIRDVIKPYGIQRIVHIAENAQNFIKAIEAELYKSNKKQWIKEVDRFLSNQSWDHTHQMMKMHIIGLLNDTKTISIAS
jgi:glycosyltransferase involved in cell wall biosynthesis